MAVWLTILGWYQWNFGGQRNYREWWRLRPWANSKSGGRIRRRASDEENESEEAIKSEEAEEESGEEWWKVSG
jgi:hypothetical protein